MNEDRLVSWLRDALVSHGAVVGKAETGTNIPGHPDLCIRVRHQHLPYGLLVEVKCHDGGRVKLSPSQVAWHVRHSRLGLAAFVLALDTKAGVLRLFDGSQVTSVRLATRVAAQVPFLRQWAVTRRHHVMAIAADLLDAATSYQNKLSVVSREWPDAKATTNN